MCATDFLLGFENRGVLFEREIDGLLEREFGGDRIGLGYRLDILNCKTGEQGRENEDGAVHLASAAAGGSALKASGAQW